MPRELTEAAKAAKIIRTKLKEAGLAVTVRSSNYSMGNSVDVKIFDQKPEIRQLVEAYCGNYQYGSFDGMQDLYEYTNRRNDIPQAKFVHVSNELSDGLRDEIYQFVRHHWSGGENLPEKYDDARSIQFQGEWVDMFVFRQFTTEDSSYWRHVAEAKRPEPIGPQRTPQNG